MPPKNKPTKKAGTHPKIDPAPRDRSAFCSMKYPQLNEGGLNKYARSEKDIDIALKSRFTSDSKETTTLWDLK